MPDTTRQPRAFDLGDPAVREPEVADMGEATAGVSQDIPVQASRRGAFSWAKMLAAALGALFLLASGLWFASFLSVAFERQDALGWLAFALLAIAVFAFLMLALREAAGLLRLGRLADVRAAVDGALRAGPQKERAAVDRLASLYASRAEMRWPLARLADHRRDVRDTGDLLKLAERELIAPLDKEARRVILSSAKRAGVVTALSPSGFLAVGFVLYENLRLLRALARLYGGRPGALGGLKLARMVAVHMAATGGVAFTDDLFGQFLGQDLLRRVSRRLGEGAFNSALTARIGVAAVGVCRPMPFIEAPPIRLRSLFPELFRGLRDAASAGADKAVQAARGKPPDAPA